METTPPMTFDALPYAMLRRVLVCLDRREMVEVSCADVKQAVLSFCLWERTPAAEGGGRAGPRGDNDGDGGPNDNSAGAPIYRFLGEVDREAERRRNGGRDLKTILASYPRSGNSLLRRLLEEATGIVTGSDTRPDRTLSRSLSVFGMQGEGVVDERVRVVKTHFPERAGFREFQGKRVVLLVRNPFDAIDSYFNMALTNTHDKSLHEGVYSEFAGVWDAMIRNEIKVWERFYSYWLSSGIPVHVVRFEDLVSRTEGCLRETIAFILEMSASKVEDIYGDMIRRAPAVVLKGGRKATQRITRSGTASAGTANGRDRGRHSSAGAVRAGTAGPYKPRASGGMGWSLEKRFSREQVEWCAREARDHLRMFGYDPESQGFPPASGVEMIPLKVSLLLPEHRSVKREGSGGVTNGSISTAASTDTRVEVACLDFAASREADRQAPNGPSGPVTVTVNDRIASPLVRHKGDAFGRALTTFRRTHTARDTRPLPLQGEDEKTERWRHGIRSGS